MKSFICVVLIAVLVLNVNAGNKCKGSKNVKNETKAERYIGYAKNYEKRAKIAKDAGNSELATALTACANAKRTMSKAYETGDDDLQKKGRSAYGKARKELSKFEKKNSCTPKKKKSKSTK